MGVALGDRAQGGSGDREVGTEYGDGVVAAARGHYAGGGDQAQSGFEADADLRALIQATTPSAESRTTLD
ncbi:hypothetical protein GCM10009638_26970 [Luteococcus sanguinis]